MGLYYCRKVSPHFPSVTVLNIFFFFFFIMTNNFLHIDTTITHVFINTLPYREGTYSTNTSSEFSKQKVIFASMNSQKQHKKIYGKKRRMVSEAIQEEVVETPHELETWSVVSE